MISRTRQLTLGPAQRLRVPHTEAKGPMLLSPVVFVSVMWLP